MSFGMEMMLARMIGMTPEQMREQIGETKGLLEKFVSSMTEINEKLDKVLAWQERADENDNGSHNAASGNRGRRKLPAPAASDSGGGGNAAD